MNSSAGTAISFLPAFFSSRRRQELLLAGVAIAVYIITLGNGFVFDDSIAIKQNQLVTQGFHGIGDLLTTPYHYGYTSGANVAAYPLYRPLSLVLFAIEYGLTGDSPVLGHFVNLLLFAGCVILLFRFIDRLFSQQQTAVAFVAGLLFAIHPIHTEVVANIKSCDEMLCFFFSFLALNKLLSYAQKGSIISLVTGGLFYFLALLSKETAITFLAVIPLIFFFYCSENKKRSILIMVAAVAAAGIWFAIRSSVFTAYELNEYKMSFLDNSLVAAPSSSSRLATAFLILGHYLRLLFVPYPLFYDYSFNSVPFAEFGNISVILSVLAYAGLAAFGLFRLIRKPKDILAFGILFFLITISLFSNVFFLIGSNMAERFLFFPSVGFCIVVAYGLTHLPVVKDKIWLVLAPIVLVFAVLSFVRSTQWKDNLTLFRTDAKKSPDSWRIYYNYGLAQFQDLIDKHQEEAPPKGVLEEGIKAFQKSVAIYPDYELSQDRLATAFLASGMYDSAEVHLVKLAQINPANQETYKKLSMMYLGNNQYRNALRAFNAIAARRPDAPVYSLIGACYMKLAKYDSAVAALRIAYRQQPGATTIKSLVYSFGQLGMKDSASKYQAMLQ